MANYEIDTHDIVKALDNITGAWERFNDGIIMEVNVPKDDAATLALNTIPGRFHDSVLCGLLFSNSQRFRVLVEELKPVENSPAAQPFRGVSTTGQPGDPA
jgi:hypothetical protein